MNTLLDSAEPWLSPMALLSWKGTLLTLVVGASLLLLRRHLSPAWRHGLWLLVMLRFLLPDLGTSHLSISSITPAPIPAVMQETSETPLSPVDDDALEFLPNAPQEMMPEASMVIAPAMTPPQAVAWSISQRLTLMWLGGAAAVLGLMVLLHVRLLLRIRRDAVPASAEVATILRKACDLAHIRRMPRLICTDAIRAPSLFGVLRPAILLPKAVAENEKPAGLQLIFLHELAHMKRWDLVSQIIASLAIALHWYNPAVWWAGRRLRAEAEMAADSHALRSTGTGAAEAHHMGELLLGFANHAAAAWVASFLAFTQMGISDNKQDLRRRIEALMDIARGRRTRWFVGLSVFFLFALTGLTNAPAEDAPKKAAPDAKSAAAAKAPAATGTLTVTGQVVDPQGKPIADATCFLRSGDELDYEQRKLTSDAEGRFKFEAVSAQGPLRVWARHPRFQDAQQPMPDLTPQEAANLRLVLEPVTNWVRGTITNEKNGKPIKDATVYLKTGALTSLPAVSWLTTLATKVQTDEAGHYQFPRQKQDAEAMLAVEAPGMWMTAVKFTWEKGEMTKDIALAADPGISGRVTNADGKAVEDASLSITTSYYGLSLAPMRTRHPDMHYSVGRGYWMGNPVTDANGDFKGRTIREDPTNEPWLVATHPVAGIQQVPLKEWTNGQTIILEKWRSIHGTLLDAEDKPMKNKELKLLQLFPAREGSRFSISHQASCVTDDQGRYRMEGLLPRSITASVRVDGEYIQLPGGGWTPGMDLEHTLRMRSKADKTDASTTSGKRHVKGRLVLPSTPGKPLPKHELRVSISLAGASVESAQNSEVDGQGHFTSNMLPPGQYELRAWVQPQDRGFTYAFNSGLTKRFALATAESGPLDLGELKLDAADFDFISRTAPAPAPAPATSYRREQRVEVELAEAYSFESWSGCGGSETSPEQKFTPQGGIVGTVPASNNGRFMLRATKKDGTRYFSAAQLVTPEGQDVFKSKLAFTPGVLVEGVLRDLPKTYAGGGWAVASVRVSVEVAPDAVQRGGIPYLIWHAWTPVRKDGTFRFHGLPRGSLEITAMDVGWISRNPRGHSTDVKENLLTAGPVLKLNVDTQPSLQGRVRVFRPDGTPAAGASLALQPPSNSNLGRALGRWNYATEQADAKAYATFKKQKTAGHFAIADADGYASLANIPQDNMTFEVTWTDAETKDRHVERANLRLNVAEPQIKLQGKKP